jgi:hypothetical protein
MAFMELLAIRLWRWGYIFNPQTQFDVVRGAAQYFLCTIGLPSKHDQSILISREKSLPFA